VRPRARPRPRRKRWCRSRRALTEPRPPGQARHRVGHFHTTPNKDM
jgi:hypothetical protein